MKSHIYVSIILAASMATSAAQAAAAEVEVTWQDKDGYSDVRAAQESQSQYEEQVFARFEEIFQELGEKLPADQTLRITVTDVDLAGEVLPIDSGIGMEMMRVVNRNRLPKVDLNYELVDANGNVLKSGEESIRSRSIERSRAMSSEFMEHERIMLTRWFRSNFESA